MGKESTADTQEHMYLEIVESLYKLGVTDHISLSGELANILGREACSRNAMLRERVIARVVTKETGKSLIPRTYPDFAKIVVLPEFPQDSVSSRRRRSKRVTTH